MKGFVYFKFSINLNLLNCCVQQKCITAVNKSWHPEHFLCAACGQQFGDAGFHEKDGKVYCRYLVILLTIYDIYNIIECAQVSSRSRIRFN